MLYSIIFNSFEYTVRKSRMSIYIICLVGLLQIALPNKLESGLTGVIYTSEKSDVRFFSHAPLEDIDARSSKLRAAMDMESGKLLFLVPINSFEFDKNLMQKHFNTQYLESDKFPEARFEGQFSEAPVVLNGSKELGFEGLLTVHGIGHRITGTARLKQAGEIIYGESNFQVKLADYKIKIPIMVIKNIAEVVDVSIYVQFTRETNN